MSVPQGEAEEQDTPWPSHSADPEEWSPPLCLPCPPSGQLPLQTFWCIPKVSGVGLHSLRSSTQMSPSQSDCPWPSAPPWDSLPVLLLSLVLLSSWNILFLFFVCCLFPSIPMSPPWRHVLVCSLLCPPGPLTVPGIQQALSQYLLNK